ncbi:MAG: hypothetical protein LBT78_12285 [Tannerella sp.]|jgi:hypothetical protein|nr:hypothetical protein [Tannerella sp.]
MKTIKKQFIYLTLLLVCCSCAKKEKLLIGGAGWPQIAIIDKASGTIEWSHPLAPEEECNDVEATSRGEILYAGKQSAKLITRKHQPVWSYEAKEGEAIYTATILESGNYMLAIAGLPARIVELDKKGVPVKEVSFHAATPDIDRQFRHILKTPQNTYLVPLMDKHKVSELNDEGRVLKSILCGGNPFSVQLTEDGKWLVSCGDAHSFVEIDPEARKIVKTVESGDLNYGALLCVSELIRYRNGNTLIANWNGHSEDTSQPLLLELDSTNRVVWRLAYNPEITNISTVYSFFE